MPQTSLKTTSIYCPKIQKTVEVIYSTYEIKGIQSNERADTCNGAKQCGTFGLQNFKLPNPEQIQMQPHLKAQCPIFSKPETN